MQARGVYGQIGAQYESVYGTDPGVPDLKLIYFESEGLKSSQNQSTSKLQTGDRMTTEPLQGNIDVSGQIKTELGALPGILYVAAAGSVKTEGNSGAGETLGAALTEPAGVIDPFLQTLTVTSAAHGLAVGDMIQIAGLTAPTELNSTYVRVVSITSENVFVCRIPMGVSTTWTLGTGTLKKVTAAAGTYKHTIEFGGMLPSLVIEKGFTDISKYFKYNGCVCGKMAIAIKPEGAQDVTFDFSGQKETPDTSSFDAAPTDPGKASFSGFQAAIEEGEATIANVTKIDNLTCENTLDTDQFVIGGLGFRKGLPEGKAKITGSLEALFEDMALYTKAVNFTTSSLEVEYTRGTGAGTLGNEKLTINIPHLKFKREAPAIGGEGGVLVSLPFEAFHEPGSYLMRFTILSPELTI